eukprot:TRINITY_DN6195_c0_g1_i1.p1 TRINITY_DN6195_c0_g1~~TRINITY_DN6195_c0_g1_i1.p1  ORF type:complete len:140 (-),score=41.27 TRINITY_DN6195_c0_g1_i1:113-532(-)
MVQMRELDEVLSLLNQHNVAVAVIGSGNQNFASAFKTNYNVTSDMYIDEKLKAYSAFGLHRKGLGISSWKDVKTTWNVMKQITQLKGPKGVQGDSQQKGGALLIDTNGDVLFSYLNHGIGDHFSATALREALENQQMGN